MQFLNRRYVVGAAAAKFVVVLKDVRVHVLLHYGLDQPHILVISHPPPVVDLGPQVVQHLVGYRVILV